MKCRDCECAKRGYFKSVPYAHVCIGVKEPFVIENINEDCRLYKEKQAKMQMDKEKLKESLIDYFKYEMRQIGNSDYSIDNIRFFEEENKIYALADIKYTWWLNAWDKKVNMKDVLFVIVDIFGIGEWKSPIFY